MKKILIIMLVFVIVTLTACEQSKPTTDTTLIDTKRALTIDTELTDNILPVTLNGVSIEWTSSKAGLLNNNQIIQPELTTTTTLTAILTYDGVTLTKLFDVTIAGTYSELDQFIDLVDLFKEDIPSTTDQLIGNITLPQSTDLLTVSWTSDNTSCIDETGIITRPNDGDNDCIATLTVTIIKGENQESIDYSYTVKAKTTTVTYEGYYAGVDGLIGEALKSFLHDLIDDHTVFPYTSDSTDVWDILRETDEDPNNPNNVILLYSGRSQSKDSNGGNSDDWNREHVWPRSYGDLKGAGGPAFTDVHHLRPTDVTVNSLRGNLIYDMGGSLVSETDDCYKDSDSFEPRDEVKGDVARMIFYMAVRYEGDSNELDLELTNLNNPSGPLMGKLDILIEWHLNDLPDAFEINRNNVIFSYQGNRNPFIDHPELVELIWN